MRNVIIEKVMMIGYTIGVVLLSINHNVLVGIGFLLYPLLFLIVKKFVIKEDTEWNDRLNIYIVYVLFRVIILALMFDYFIDFYNPDMSNIPTQSSYISYTSLFNIDFSTVQFGFISLAIIYLPSALIEGAILTFLPIEREYYHTNLMFVLYVIGIVVTQFIVYNVLYYLHYIMIYVFGQV